MTGICIAHGGDISTPSGGTDRVTAFVSGLQERDHDVRLVVPEPAGSLSEELRGISVHRVNIPSWADNAMMRAVFVALTAKRLAQRENRILQFEHSILAGVGTLVGAPSYVLDMHDLAYSRYDHVDMPLTAILKKGIAWLEQRAVDRANHVVVVSEHMKRQLQMEWNIAPAKISVIPNGYFPKKIERTMDIKTEPGQICFLGTLHPKVDVEALVEVSQLSLVSKLVVIGDGAQRERLEELQRQYPALKVVGRLPDRPAFEHLARAAVAINPQHPSKLQRSSSPVKLYYYAAMGKAMVISTGPTIAESLATSDAAITVESSEEVAAAVNRVLKNPQLKAKLEQNARQRAEEFTWNSRVAALADLYRDNNETGIPVRRD